MAVEKKLAVVVDKHLVVIVAANRQLAVVVDTHLVVDKYLVVVVDKLLVMKTPMRVL